MQVPSQSCETPSPARPAAASSTSETSNPWRRASCDAVLDPPTTPTPPDSCRSWVRKATRNGRVTVRLPPGHARTPLRRAPRLAFVGQATFFERARSARRRAPLRHDVPRVPRGRRPGAARGRARRLDPDVVVVFRPEIIPAGALRGLRATTRRLPDRAAAGTRRRAAATTTSSAALWSSATSTGELRPHRRLRPPLARPPTPSCPSGAPCRCPSTTAYYAPVARAPAAGARTLFVGRSTQHREPLLKDAKHRRAPAPRVSASTPRSCATSWPRTR